MGKSKKLEAREKRHLEATAAFDKATAALEKAQGACDKAEEILYWRTVALEAARKGGGRNG